MEEVSLSKEDVGAVAVESQDLQEEPSVEPETESGTPELAIRSLGSDDESTQRSSAYDHLPNFAGKKKARILVVGASSCGKTTMLKNLVLRPEFGVSSWFGEGKQAEIFIISETLHMSGDWLDLGLPEEHLLDHWDATRIRQMMQYSKKTKTGTLWILDDMINSSDAVSMSRSSLLNRLYMQGRHWKISIVLVSQKYTYIPSAIRINASHLCMYGANSKEQKTLFDEIANVDDLPRKYSEAVSNPYGFLYLELTSGRTFQCFERELL